jgi:hypothetical protein
VSSNIKSSKWGLRFRHDTNTISIIQDADHPFLAVWVHSLRDKAECEALTKKDMDSVMGKLRRHLSDEMRSEAKACKVCGKSGVMKRCARSKAVAYCGIEHQRVDLKIHNKFCVLSNRERSVRISGRRTASKTELCRPSGVSHALWSG